MTFFARVKLAFSVLFGGEAPKPAEAPKELPAPVAAPAPVKAKSPEEEHASALYLLSLLQREGRFFDFVREDITQFSDADVGAAARLVHQGCRKVIEQYLNVAPVRTESEGAAVSIAKGYDANRLRLTGNVTGEGPWKGALKHHGWAATKITLPPVPTSIDLTVLAPAEVELS